MSSPRRPGRSARARPSGLNLASMRAPFPSASSDRGADDGHEPGHAAEVVQALVARGRALRVGVDSAREAEVQVVMLGIASAALYLLLYLAERRIFFNGLVSTSGPAAPDHA